MQAELLEYFPQDLVTYIIEPYCYPTLDDYQAQLRHVRDLVGEFKNLRNGYSPHWELKHYEHIQIHFWRQFVFDKLIRAYRYRNYKYGKSKSPLENLFVWLKTMKE
jgi:hypothetical protein